MLYYQVDKSKVLAHLGSSADGLSAAEAAQRRRQHGANILQPIQSRRWLRNLIAPFASWVVAILLAAAVLSFVAGKNLDGVVIVIIVGINALIYYSQSFSSARVLAALRRQDARFVLVRRGDLKRGKLQLHKVAAEDITIGDIVVLSEGQKVPADGRIISANDAQIDQSALTGESQPVHKSDAALNTKRALSDQTNMVFKGTIVVAGSCECVIVAIGNNTEFGRIARLASKGEPPSPLQTKIDHLTTTLVKLVGGVVVVAFGLSLWRGSSLYEALRLTLTLAVSAVPEGLPVAVSVVLIIGSSRLAKRKALVRNLSAIETLGQVNLIATDKTGTITHNRLSIADTFVPQTQELAELSYSVSPHPEEQTEQFERVLFARYAKRSRRHFARVLHFSQQLRLSGTVWQDGSHSTTYIKGAAEAVVRACKLTPAQRKAAEVFIHTATEEGYRVIGFAKKGSAITTLTSQSVARAQWLGLIAFGDSLRDGVGKSVEQAHGAGIDVILLSGDHAGAVGHFAEATGISPHHHALEASEIIGLDRTEIRRLIHHHKALGRVLPEHKYAIIEALERGDVIAMTGDGINDVPALVKANVGIAMGSGTDAAKESADVVLLDDNFNTIVRAVAYGRAIYANVTHMLSYLFATNFAEVLVIVLALVVGLPAPVTPLQILWINLVTDGFTVIPLGLEKPESDLMAHSPVRKTQPLLPRRLLIRMLLIALVMAGLTLGAFYVSLPRGLVYAQTVSFITLVVVQWANVLANRSDTRSFIYGFIHPNWLLFGALGLAALLQLVLVLTPLGSYFNLTGIGVDTLWWFGVSFAVVLLVSDVLKRVFVIPARPQPIGQPSPKQ